MSLCEVAAYFLGDWTQHLGQSGTNWLGRIHTQLLKLWNNRVGKVILKLVFREYWRLTRLWILDADSDGVHCLFSHFLLVVLQQANEHGHEVLLRELRSEAGNHFMEPLGHNE